jgi:hypothetical protein
MYYSFTLRADGQQPSLDINHPTSCTMGPTGLASYRAKNSKARKQIGPL